MANSLSDALLINDKQFTSGSANYVYSNNLYANPAYLTPSRHEYSGSNSGIIYFGANPTSTPSTPRLVLAVSGPDLDADLEITLSQRTNSPSSVQIRYSYQHFHLSSYTEGDGDGAAGRWISHRKSSGWNMIANYGEIYVNSYLYGNYPNQFRDGYQHYYIDFQNMQGHTLYCKLTQLKDVTRQWRAWWEY